MISLAIIAGGLLLYWLANRLVLARARSHAHNLPAARRGRPVLLYFSSPTCAPCRTVQRPAIQRLSEMVAGRLEVVEIDASERPELASQWGVLSVPTTLVIDAHGKPRHVNHGVAPVEKLLSQIQDLLS
jgi:thioredoxin-like negative regulator of GroEL